MMDDRTYGDARRQVGSSAVALQHLRYAVSAAEHGSIRRAAEALFFSSRRSVAAFASSKNSIGMIVFERSSGGVRTTSAGRNFLRTARSILEQVEALVTTARSTGRGEAGRLVVGFYTSLSAGNLRASLIDVGQRFPQIEIEMLESSRTLLGTALRNAAVDIAIVPGATSLPETHTYVAVERADHSRHSGKPAARRQGSRLWIDLRDEKLLLSRRDPGPDLQDLLVAKLASPGDRPNIVRS